MEPPRVSVEVADCRADAQPRRWRVRWDVRNEGVEALSLEAAWIPHGRFRGDGRIPLTGEIPAAGSTRLEFSVMANEPPGTLVENAFLILRGRASGRAWRIFTRMRVQFDAQGAPHPIAQQVTTQAIGDG